LEKVTIAFQKIYPIYPKTDTSKTHISKKKKKTAAAKECESFTKQCPDIA
jgi:hypothetical protein